MPVDNDLTIAGNNETMQKAEMALAESTLHRLAHTWFGQLVTPVW